VALERARMDYMVLGYDSGDKTPLEALAYVSFQELATRVSHRNTGRASGDPIADKLLARIATDENLHMVFYRNLMAAAFDIDPDLAMRAVTTEVVGFEMPGATMAGFRKNSLLIAKAGIYDLRLHYDEVLSPVLRAWKVFERTDLGPAGEQARAELAEFLTGLDAQATKFVESRDRARARAAAKGQLKDHLAPQPSQARAGTLQGGRASALT
jgi:acyl-[acyl-carrier-protein] desaturase